MNDCRPQSFAKGNKISNSAKGAMHEYAAVAWLVSRGYEVFHNTCPTGPVDMIATKGDELIKIDVKTANVHVTMDGTVRYLTCNLSADQVAMGVKVLLTHDCSVLGWGDDFLSDYTPPFALSDEMVIYIYFSQEPRKALAEKFGVNIAHIGAVKTSKTVRYKRIIAEYNASGKEGLMHTSKEHLERLEAIEARLRCAGLRSPASDHRSK